MSQNPQEKINAASKGCDKVHTAWSSASAALSGTVNTNGYGIFHDPNAVRHKLLMAQKSIDSALLGLDEINWPSNSDYEK